MGGRILILFGRFFFCLFLLTITTACRPQGPRLFQLAKLPEGNICRIAILPFRNETEYISGSPMVTRIFSTQLNQRGNYSLAQEGDIFTLYQQLHIRQRQEPDLEQLRIIGDRLGVQLIVIGSIAEMTDTGGVEQKKPSLEIKIDILEAKTGKSLWTTYHSRHGDQYQKILHFGMVNSTTELVKRVSQEIIDKWFQEGMTQCSE